MKKRLKNLIYPALLMLVFMVALHVKININKTQISSINLLNIETLSYAEDINSTCYGTGSVDCPISKEKVSYVLD
jgi:hypothetical protein